MAQRRPQFVKKKSAPSPGAALRQKSGAPLARAGIRELGLLKT
jgi:hypothetical protein